MKLYTMDKTTYNKFEAHKNSGEELVAHLKKGGFSASDATNIAKEWAAHSVAAEKGFDADEAYTVAESSLDVRLVSSHKHYELMKSRQRSVLNLFKGLPARGKTSAATTHNLDIFAQRANWFNDLDKKDQTRFLKMLKRK